MTIPRTVLLSWCSPDSRYAGGEALRRVLSRLPADRIRWYGFHPGRSPAGLPEYRAIPVRRVHWRLEGTALEALYVNDWQAGALARRVWRDARDFAPEALWIIPELAAATVGLRLARRSGLPLHATLHDAPEACRQAGVPHSYAPVYIRHQRNVVEAASSVDCVSSELKAHLEATCRVPLGPRVHVVPPPAGATALGPAQARDPAAGRTRRIGACGSFRIGGRQWQAFLDSLGLLPFTFEILLFSPETGMPRAALPRNVSIVFKPYADAESDVVEAFHCGMDAAYLGVGTDPAQAVFARTSLSSKLTTYSAAGVPVLVDAPADSVAWRLVRDYDAGIRCAADVPGQGAAITALLSDAAAWTRMAAGAARMCEREFSPARVAEAVARLLQADVGRRRGLG